MGHIPARKTRLTMLLALIPEPASSSEDLSKISTTPRMLERVANVIARESEVSQKGCASSIPLINTRA